MNVLRAFSVFKLDSKSSKALVDRCYRKFNTMFLCGQLSESDYLEIENAYQVLCNHFDKLKEEEKQEKEFIKERFIFDTLRIEEEYENRVALENEKGKVWVFFNSVIETCFDGSVDDYLEYIKQGTLENLDSEYKDLYKEFFELFLLLWTRVYKRICVCEKNNLLHGMFEGNYCYAFGEDELLDTYFRKNRVYALGKFSRLLELGRILSRLVPGEEDNYFFDKHLSFMSSFYGFGYNASDYNGIPIYMFVTTSRLQQLKMNFYDMFDEQVRMGIRKSPFVDNHELLMYIYENLKVDNSSLDENIKQRLLM